MLELQEPISGRYHLQQRLRRGGMSDVYLAYDELTQRQVAIKLVGSDNTECMQRLDREVRTMSKLSHNHILPTQDYGTHGSYHYLVMPFMKRGNLRERLAKDRLTQEEAGNILTQVASALQHAHDHGIVHRDIKPSNILLDNTDEQRVYLADFGLAKVMGEGSDITQTGCLIGTPEYMAPELADMPESVSSDIYALGVLLYQMLTGRAPFTGGTPLSVYWKHLREQPVPPSHLNAAISAPVEQVILRALDKEPSQRFSSARAMAQAYEKALQVSEYAEAAPAPALVTVHKLGSGTLPDVVRQALLWWQRPRRNIQKGIVGLVAIVFLATPLSMGFLIARSGSQAASISSAQLANQTLQGHHPSTPTPPSTAVVHSLSGNSGQFANPVPQPKHKHKHKHGNGDGDGDAIVSY